MKLDFREVSLALVDRWATSRSVASVARVVIVSIEATDTHGWGEAAPISRYGESVESVQRFVRHVDADRLDIADIPASMRYLDGLAAGEHAAKSALEVALVDAAARRAGQAVYEQLQLGFTEAKHITSFTIGIAAPDEVRRKVSDAADYPILKLKLGSPHDRASLAALREVAPHKLVRIDANEAWKSKEQAVEMLNWLALDQRIEFVEQPMPATTANADLAWLKQRSALPLIADESFHTASDIERCAEGFHGVNVKLAKTAGIGGALSALRAARACGLRTMLGCMVESSVAISAAAQLAELCDYLDLDGNLLVSNDPFQGVTAERGVLSFANAVEPCGLRACARHSTHG